VKHYSGSKTTLCFFMSSSVFCACFLGLAVSAPFSCLAESVGLLTIIKSLWADIAPLYLNGRLALLSCNALFHQISITVVLVLSRLVMIMRAPVVELMMTSGMPAEPQ